MVPEIERSEDGDRFPFVQEPGLEISDQEFDRIRKVLLFKRGFNLTGYKDNCVKRRIAIRIRATHCESVRQYCDLLDVVKDELDKLLKVLTIHVSQFFRNFSAFEILRTEIIPELFDRARIQGRNSLRFWSLGCSSGEEPYSLAILLSEYFADDMNGIAVTIDASDIDENILNRASEALYGHERLLELPEKYLQRYFSPEGGEFRLVERVRGMVNFAHGEIFNPLIYKKADLILCRNVLIYFTREQQDKVLALIRSSLADGGYLMLGKSETVIGEGRSLFQTVSPIERIYRPVL